MNTSVIQKRKLKIIRKKKTAKAVSVPNQLLFDFLADDIIEIILNYKKYMNKEYIKKILSKNQIHSCLAALIPKGSKLSNFNYATTDKYLNTYLDYMIHHKTINTLGKSENTYIYDAFNVKMKEVEEKKTVHRYKVGDIVEWKCKGAYGGECLYCIWMIKNLTKKGYTMEALITRIWQEEENPNYCFCNTHSWFEVDLDNLHKASNKPNTDYYHFYKKVSVKEEDVQQLKQKTGIYKECYYTSRYD